MADVTGPIHTLPGSRHRLPEGATCDDHPDRPAIARIQGETDSFGSELNDMCQECLDEYRRALASPDARTGTCDWCGAVVTDLSDARDYDEGLSGPVYRVCASCRKRRNDRAAEEAAEFGGHWDDWDEALE